MIATPWSRSRRTIVNSRLTSSSVSDDVGSSRASTFNPGLRARVISTSWRCAGDSSAPRRSIGTRSATPTPRSAGHGAQPPPVDERPAGRQLAEEQVLGDRDTRNDLGLLIGDADAGVAG